MHRHPKIDTIAEMPTRMYTIAETSDPAPKIASTRLKFNAPTNPQFKPPTMTSTQTIQPTTHLPPFIPHEEQIFIVLLFVYGPFSQYTTPVL